jgi:cyclopropane fatty-acyl-phospholipid synthase-like methyltransferase
MSFEPMYATTPPWDIGRAQPVMVELEAAGRIGHRVIDVGCGTGDNALYMATRRHEVEGIDAAPTAIRKAREKSAAMRDSAPSHVPTFFEGDALSLPDLPGLGMPFDSAIDTGLFHTFGDEERPLFAASLAGVVRPAGTYYMLCFSDRQPGTFGPRRVTQREIRETFREEAGWRVDSIEPAEFETLLPIGNAQAWLASITRVGSGPGWIAPRR